MEKKELVIKDRYELDKPTQMIEMANVVKNHVIKQELFTPIQGKNYVGVEGWQFAGELLGIFPRIVRVENMSSAQEVKWFTEVELFERSTDKIVGRGFAVCSSKENKKKSFDEYAILSSSQTRAIGKAYRGLIGWLMKVAGYEGTPAEEMKHEPVIVQEPDSNESGIWEETEEIIRLAKEMKVSEKQLLTLVSKGLKREVTELNQMTHREAKQVLSALLRKKNGK